MRNQGGIEIEVIEDRPYDEIIDETCPSCRMAVPAATTKCPHCGYAVEGKKAVEKAKPAMEGDHTNAVTAALIIILAILAFVSAGVSPIMAIPVGLLAIIMLVLSVS